MCLVGAHMTNKVYKVSAMVYKSTVACMFTAMVMGKSDKMTRVLRVTTKQKVTSMKMISALVDQINEDEAQYAAKRRRR